MGAGQEGSNINWAPYKAPLLGQFFDNPNEIAMKKRMLEGSEALAAYRPVQQQARMNALQQSMSLFNPVNSALGQMYGPGAQFDLNAASQNPLDPYANKIGQPNPWKEIGPKEAKGQKWGAALGTLLGPLVMTGIGQGIGGAIGRRRDRRGG